MNENNRTLTDGVIWKQLLKFFFPIMLGTFFQQLYNTVDAIVVGSFAGKEALSAVGGSASQIIQLLVGFFVGLTSGAAVVISQYYGAGDREGTRRAVGGAVAVSLVAGLILTAVGIPLARPLLGMMGTPAETLAPSQAYLTIYFAGIVPQLLFNSGSSILRALGDSKRPLYYLIACCVLNAALDVLFVGGLHMGAAGAAVATVIAQVVSAALVLSTMLRSEGAAHLSPKEIRIEKRLTSSILRIGLPEGLQAAMYSIANLLIQVNVNRFGLDAVAAWTVLGKVDGLNWMVMGAFGIAVTTFSGQNFGARKIERIKRGVRTCWLIATGFSMAFGLLMYLFGGKMFSLFGADAEVRALGLRLLYLFCPLYCTYPAIEILSGAMRGAGEVFVPTLMTLSGICLFRLAWIYFVLPSFWSMEVLAYSYPISWVITSLMFLVYYRSGRWLRRAI